MPASPARRRYDRRVLWLSLLYVALLLPAVYLLSRQLVAAPLAYGVGVLPALPILGFFAAFGVYLSEEADEYLRMLVVRQSLVATGLILAAATVWGFLEGFDLAPHVVAWVWPIVWCAGLGLDGCVGLPRGGRRPGAEHAA